MLDGIKWIAILVCLSVVGYTVYDYGTTKKRNAELAASNAALEESNKSVETLLQKLDALSAKVDNSLLRVQEQSEKLDKVSRDVRRVGVEAKRNDETYRLFVATPIHPTSLRMFDQARSSSDVQDENLVTDTAQPAEGHTSSTGVKARR